MKSILLVFTILISGLFSKAYANDYTRDMLTIPSDSKIFFGVHFDLKPGAEITEISYACYFRHKALYRNLTIKPGTELTIVGSYYKKSSIYHNSIRGLKVEGVQGLEAIECQSDVYKSVGHLKENLNQIEATLIE